MMKSGSQNISGLDSSVGNKPILFYHHYILGKAVTICNQEIYFREELLKNPILPNFQT